MMYVLDTIADSWHPLLVSFSFISEGLADSIPEIGEALNRSEATMAAAVLDALMARRG